MNYYNNSFKKDLWYLQEKFYMEDLHDVWNSYVDKKYIQYNIDSGNINSDILNKISEFFKNQLNKSSIRPDLVVDVSVVNSIDDESPHSATTIIPWKSTLDHNTTPVVDSSSPKQSNEF
uniref:Uncharacterized protein n=1 Tax=Beauveria lii TaxID=1290591 RepID=A0A7S6PVW4_9HYPO|nr:hypothetical protein J2C28_mgp26 [Beauveria lii]QOU11071.1 hypothetical protein [Beauveria lii]